MRAPGSVPQASTTPSAASVSRICAHCGATTRPAPPSRWRSCGARASTGWKEELRAVVTAGRRKGELRSAADAWTVARRVQSTYYGLRVLARVQDDRQALLDTVESALAEL
ncbi:TetR family transcriptional regulator C-terminal domain-containing protein [Streptomyces sp. NPDC051218]|uniref:TetR family transcriptional regulator C-terminal domain-containing protein n=1 Tax=Streptomyces sp. NPDC051218 TaxID=3365645 RepID=UPI0037A1FEAA